MTPAARLQAAIEIVDLVIDSARLDGPPADIIVSRYLKQRRYAGAKDRRAIREWVFRAIRAVGERPSNGRAALQALDEARPLFDGSPHGPPPFDVQIDGIAAEPILLPSWILPKLSPLVSESEWPALLERAPVDLRSNIARVSRAELLEQFADGRATSLSPWGIRLPHDSRLDDHPALRDGLAEVQDEGSQLVALACAPANGDRILDLCAGAGGKALALAAAVPHATILATDSNRARLAKLAPRATRASTTIESRLINPPRELEDLADWREAANLVLIDAPCSGSGTWRRNPEGRWRLTPERLDRLADLQQRLLDIGQQLVKPGGCLVYAVCSLLSREGAMQIERFLNHRSSWISEPPPIPGGRLDGAGRLLTPGHDRTDGFFVARLRRPC